MENDIAFLTTTYLFTRLAVVAAFAYAFYRVLRPSPVTVTNAHARAGSQRQQRIVFDDHCQAQPTRIAIAVPAANSKHPVWNHDTAR